MPFVTDTVDTFSNELFTGEILDSGDDVQTVFSGTLSKNPVFIEGAEITFTIGTVVYGPVVSDSLGVWTHAEITTSQLNEDGTWNITFNNPPDNATNILIDFTTKGILQKVQDFVTGDQFEETVGTGDDVLTNFVYNPLNEMAKGQIRIKFRILGVWYWAYDNGIGEFIHDKISSSTIVYTTTQSIDVTFTDPIENTFDIDILYTDSMIEGRDWLLFLDQNSKDSVGSDAFPGLLLKEKMFRNSGSNYIEDIVFGFRENQYIPSNQYLIELNLYKDFEEDDFQSQDWNVSGFQTSYDNTREHWLNHPSSAFNNATMTYWIKSTKDYIFLEVAVSGTVYTGFFCGKGIRFSSKENYKYPLFAIGNGSGNFSFSSTSANHSSVIDTKLGNQAWVIDKDEAFQNINTTGSSVLLIPTQDYSASGDLEKTTQIPGEVKLSEMFIVQSNNNNLLFQLPDLYHTPYIDMSTEDTLTNGGDTYLVFQNIFRTSTFDFFAIKQND